MRLDGGEVARGPWGYLGGHGDISDLAFLKNALAESAVALTWRMSGVSLVSVTPGNSSSSAGSKSGAPKMMNLSTVKVFGIVARICWTHFAVSG